MANSIPDYRHAAAVPRLAQAAYRIGMEATAGHTLDHGWGVVRRPVIHKDNLMRRCGLCQDALHGFREMTCAVVDRNHDTDAPLVTRGDGYLLFRLIGGPAGGPGSSRDASAQRGPTVIVWGRVTTPGAGLCRRLVILPAWRRCSSTTSSCGWKIRLAARARRNQSMSS